MLFNKFDIYGNLLEQQKSDDVGEVYLWGYDSQYPVAKIIGTTYELARTYVSQSILDAPLNETQLRLHLNNLRQIPNVLVTTYTYKPLVGITSQSDYNGNTTYYSYDGMGRLVAVRDKDLNFIKTVCYNYADQGGTCNIYVNDSRSESFTRNNCGSGYSGSTVAVQIPQGMFVSTSSVTDANQQADLYGQQQANMIAGCSFTDVLITLNNNAATSGYRAVFTKSGAETQFLFPASGTVNFSIAPGVYSVSIAPIGGPGGNHSYSINGVGSQQGNSATFSNLTLSAAGTIVLNIN